MIDRLALDWYSAKTFLEHSIAFSDDVLHVLAGVGIQLVLAAIIRGSAANALPLGNGPATTPDDQSAEK